MDPAEKKRQKAEAKRAKKSAKAELKAQTRDAPPGPAAPERGASPAVRFAEAVRGVLYVLLGASLAVALILGQRGMIVSLDDVIGSLFAASAGKVVLSLIALAFLIYGLKHLRLVR